MVTTMTNDIQTLLGEKAETLLGFDSPKIPKERLHLPGPDFVDRVFICLLYTSPSPRDRQKSRMPSSA